MRGLRDQDIGWAFGDMQALIADFVLGLKRLTLLAVARFDGFLELESWVGRREHRRRMSADHVQLSLGQGGNIKAMADDAGVQGAVFAIGIADIDRSQDDATSPGFFGFHHQYWRRAVAQQFPVIGGEQGFFQWVVGEVLLDHQAAAFGLLHVDDGLVLIFIPGLLAGGAEPFAVEQAGKIAQVAGVIIFLVAHQQMQVRLSDTGNQFGAFQCQVFRVIGLHHHQNAANSLHDHLHVQSVVLFITIDRCHWLDA